MYVISDLNSEKIAGKFCKRQSKQNLGLKK